MALQPVLCLSPAHNLERTPLLQKCHVGREISHQILTFRSAPLLRSADSQPYWFADAPVQTVWVTSV